MILLELKDDKIPIILIWNTQKLKCEEIHAYESFNSFKRSVKNILLM